MATRKTVAAALALSAAFATLPGASQATMLKANEVTAAERADPRFRDVSTREGLEARRAEVARGNHQTNKGFINLSGNYEPKFNVTGRQINTLLRY